MIVPGRGRRRKHEGHVPIIDLDNGVETIKDVLVEWREGWNGQPSIQVLNAEYGRLWRKSHTTTSRYELRLAIVVKFKMLVKSGLSDEDALEAVEKDKGVMTLDEYRRFLVRRLKIKRQQRKRANCEEEAKKRDEIPEVEAETAETTMSEAQMPEMTIKRPKSEGDNDEIDHK